MRRQSLWLVLSAISVSAAACFPEYTFDLAEVDAPDASFSDDAAPTEDAAGDDAATDAAPDGDEPADAGDDASDASDADPQDAGPDGDEPEDDGGLDAGVGDAAPDADVGDAAPDADDGDAGPVDGGDDGGPPPPEPDCSEEADAGALYACVPRPPTGWSGPVALYNEAALLTPPSCPSSFFQTPIFEGHAQLDTPPADCSPCSCSVSGVTCSAPVSEQYFSGSQCSLEGCGWTPPSGSEFTPNLCVGITFENAAECPPPTSVQLGESLPSGTASCRPSTQAPTIAPVAWADNARACHAPSSDKGCDSGFVCAPKAIHPFEPNLCIVRLGEGDVSCPEGPYSQKFIFYRDADDTRSCTDCQCGSASNVRCEGALKSYSSTTGCQNEDGSIPLGSCGNFGPTTQDGDEYLKVFRLSVEAKATCPASGGQPIGTVTPTRPQTVCCMP